MANLRIAVRELRCPQCGAKEMHPTKDQLLIRGFKVLDQGHWWSQCLVCAGYYDPTTLEVNPTVGTDEFGRPLPQGFDPKKGWF